MPANLGPIEASITDLTGKVTSLSSVVDSAVALINGFKTIVDTAVANALAADNAIDDATAARLNDIVQAATSSVASKADELAASVAAGTPGNPTPQRR